MATSTARLPGAFFFGSPTVAVLVSVLKYRVAVIAGELPPARLDDLGVAIEGFVGGDAERWSVGALERWSVGAWSVERGALERGAWSVERWSVERWSVGAWSVGVLDLGQHANLMGQSRSKCNPFLCLGLIVQSILYLRISQSWSSELHLSAVPLLPDSHRAGDLPP